MEKLLSFDRTSAISKILMTSPDWLERSLTSSNWTKLSYNLKSSKWSDLYFWVLIRSKDIYCNALNKLLADFCNL